MINYFFNLPSFLIRKLKTRKISYSLTSIDLLINHIFKGKKNGYFIDVGCNHPVYNNNTYLLYKRGWSGINVDIDKKSIQLFDLYRKKDLNINSAISSKVEEVDFYFYHDKSPINTLSKKSYTFQKTKPKIIKKITTQTLESIISASVFKKKKIDFLSVDVEGHELEVLKGLNLKVYSPSIIVLEYLDLSIDKLEVYNFDINNILNSEIYNYMIDNDYSLVNWFHSDLVFAHNKFKF
jgi:FkbM family methyltransferase